MRLLDLMRKTVYENRPLAAGHAAILLALAVAQARCQDVSRAGSQLRLEANRKKTTASREDRLAGRAAHRAALKERRSIMEALLEDLSASPPPRPASRRN